MDRPPLFQPRLCVIGDCVQGRGYQAPADLQLLDSRRRSAAQPCCVVRPLRDVSSKELALHAFFRQLPTLALPLPSASGASASQASVGDLCHGFVSMLTVRSFSIRRIVFCDGAVAMVECAWCRSGRCRKAAQVAMAILYMCEQACVRLYPVT